MRKYLLALILLAALVLRLYSLQTYVDTHSRRALGAIPFLFEPGNIAYSMATGHGFASPFRTGTGPTAWMTPVYPAILAAIFRLFGTYTFQAFLAAALLNIAFSTLTCVPLFHAARRVSGLTLAVIAASLWAIFPNAIILPYESLWDQSLAALLAATILWSTLAKRPAWEQGFLWGLTLMTTPTLAVALPFLLLWTWKQGTRGASRTLLIAILCCIPWTIRNYQIFHTLVPLRTVMGLSLWLGNNPNADGINTNNRHPISNSTERSLYTQRGEIAYDATKRSEASEYIRTHPKRTAQLIGRRFIAIWTGGTLHPIDDLRNSKSVWFKWVLLFNLTASITAAAGIIMLFRRHNPYAFPVAVFPIIFPIAYYLTLAPPRYRHPIDPVILLLTGVTLQAIWQNISKYTRSTHKK